MPRKCSICTDKIRMEIGEAIVAGEALRDIAIRFGKSTAAVYRHKSKCIKNKLVPAVRAEERIQEIRQRAAEGDLIEDLVELREMTREIALKNEEEGRHSIALKAIREEARLIELEAKMTGRFAPQEPVQNYRPMIVVDRHVDLLPTRSISQQAKAIDVTASDVEE